LGKEIGFAQFETDEVLIGLDYALQHTGVKLVHDTLRIAGSTAGAIMQEKGCKPRTAACQALHRYAQRNRLDFPHDRFEAYVRAIAKMMSDRSARARSYRKKAA
jgi:hypothetical protein